MNTPLGSARATLTTAPVPQSELPDDVRSPARLHALVEISNPSEHLGPLGGSLAPLDGREPGDHFVRLSAEAQRVGQMPLLQSTEEATESRIGLLRDASDDIEAGCYADSPALHSIDDVIRYRQRHLQAAVDFVDERLAALRGQMDGAQDSDPIRALEASLLALRVELKGCMEDQQRLPQTVDANEAWDFPSLKKLKGGTRHSVKTLRFNSFKSWFSKGMRRARSIQKRAERGQSFDDAYFKHPRNLKKMHTKAALALFLRGRLKAIGLGDQEWAAAATINKSLGKKFRTLTESSARDWSTFSFEHRGINSIRAARPAPAAVQGSSAPGEAVDQAPRAGSEKFSMRSRLTPASQIGRSPGASRGVLDYSDKAGSCSMNSEDARHATNLWLTEFEPSEAGRGLIGFRGLRHGVLDAYGLGDTNDERGKANQQKVRELVKAAASEMSACLVKTESEPGGEPVWELPICSVSLQTAEGSDAAMIRRQREAMLKLEEIGVDMDPPGPPGTEGPWRVKPKFITFAIGVNDIALRGALQRWYKPWDKVDAINKDAYKSFLKIVSNKIDALGKAAAAGELSRDERAKLHVIDDLNAQVQQIMSSESYKTLDSDPYKLPARLLLLASLVGLVPAFNCKSGKDRTGMIDVEVKDLALRTNQSLAADGAVYGVVPRPGEGRLPEQKGYYKDLHLNGGSQHVSRANTGVLGNKSSIGDYLEQNLGIDEMLVGGFARHADGNK